MKQTRVFDHVARLHILNAHFPVVGIIYANSGTDFRYKNNTDFNLGVHTGEKREDSRHHCEIFAFLEVVCICMTSTLFKKAANRSCRHNESTSQGIWVGQ